ncbi:hypothetical protein ACFXGA_24805 [Actinosynnema sp. NPDC059335]|uniref:hypothetical protein n=1 Tax=Actinosynnema sp. NPDC059335 TaxID=3346804 RepID=UPI0036711FEF
MSGQGDRGRLHRAEVVALVRDWHGALERHADVERLREMLVRSGLLLRLPGATVRDGEEFARWYRGLNDSCFDQRRDVVSVAVELVSPLHAEVTVTLRWESRSWRGPAPRSRWTGCLITEQWLVVRQDGAPRIRTLITQAAQPLPGSPPPVADTPSTARTARPAAGSGSEAYPGPADTAVASGTRPAVGSTPIPYPQPAAASAARGTRGIGGPSGARSGPAAVGTPAGADGARPPEDAVVPGRSSDAVDQARGELVTS